VHGVVPIARKLARGNSIPTVDNSSQRQKTAACPNAASRRAKLLSGDESQVFRQHLGERTMIETPILVVVVVLVIAAIVWWLYR